MSTFEQPPEERLHAPLFGAASAELATPVNYRPRLSIFYFMIWTALSAGMLALLKLVMQAPDDTSRPPLAVELRTIVLAISSGANLGGTLLAIQIWRKRGRFPTLAGEWLLFMMGLQAWLMFPLIGWMFYLRRNFDDANMESLEIWFDWLNVAMTIVSAAIFVVPAIVFRGPKAWRWFFWITGGITGLKAAKTFVTLVGWPSLPQWVSDRNVFLALCGCACLFILAVMLDKRRWREQSWIHWLGITTIALQTGMDFIERVPRLFR